MSSFILSSIIATIIGLAILVLGIYEITNREKLLSKNKRTVEDPKYAGLSLVALGIISLFFAAYLFLSDESFELNEAANFYVNNIGTAGTIIGAVLLVAIGLAGLLKNRIIYFKDTPLVRKYQKKYQKTHNICCIIAGVTFAIVRFTIPNISLFDDFIINNQALFIAICQIPVLFILPVIFIDLVIEISSWRKAKK